MKEQAAAPTRHDLEAKMVKRCWEDEEFRKKFTADPAGVFVKHLQVPAASLPKIAIHQETPGSWHCLAGETATYRPTHRRGPRKGCRGHYTGGHRRGHHRRHGG
jgi:hypothetical protein